jgi:hypothetical protein
LAHQARHRVATRRLAVTTGGRFGISEKNSDSQGFSARGPGQLAIYQTLAETGERAGFDAGQAVQFNRTLYGDLGLPLTKVSQRK